ncbi:hypothetical protein [Phenylobacterium sp.]|uniref:hypothetical protein n=1 Tax=Phenylobacterium sp. TaxID=1871053 RepID=UPI00301D296C
MTGDLLRRLLDTLLLPLLTSLIGLLLAIWVAMATYGVNPLDGLSGDELDTLANLVQTLWPIGLLVSLGVVVAAISAAWGMRVAWRRYRRPIGFDNILDTPRQL